MTVGGEGSEHAHLRVRVAPEQRSALRALARQRQTSISQLLRSAIARELEASAAAGSLPDESAIREMAILIAVELVLKLQEATMPGGTTRSRQLLGVRRPRSHRTVGVGRGPPKGCRLLRSTTSVLALKYTPVSVTGGVRKAVGGFLRYVQFRDQHVEPEDGGLDAYVRYVAHRDRTSPLGRVFGEEGGRTDNDRHRLVDYISRSTRGLRPKWVRNRNGELEDRQRAVYQFIFSPKDWRGLDLRLAARKAMKQLEVDAGAGGIGPWFAAEHRNTDHHHVHIVLAARREIETRQVQHAADHARSPAADEGSHRARDRTPAPPVLGRGRNARGHATTDGPEPRTRLPHTTYRWRRSAVPQTASGLDRPSRPTCQRHPLAASCGSARLSTEDGARARGASGRAGSVRAGCDDGTGQPARRPAHSHGHRLDRPGPGWLVLGSPAKPWLQPLGRLARSTPGTSTRQTLERAVW